MPHFLPFSGVGSLPLLSPKLLRKTRVATLVQKWAKSSNPSAQKAQNPEPQRAKGANPSTAKAQNLEP